MQLKKLSDDHYVVVTDEPIKEGDWYMSPSGGIISDHNGTELLPDGWKKITHSTQPLEITHYIGEADIFCFNKVKKLDLSYVKSFVGEVDLEEKFWNIINSETPQSRDEILLEATKHGFKYGYNKCLEDNKDKRFSEEDVRKAIDKARIQYPIPYTNGDYEFELSEDDIISSIIHTPKDTWECEFINGQLKLK